jgi:hypothetical protein
LDPITVAAPKTAWRYAGWLGLVLVVVGGIDIALRWYPTSFRSPEWEFGTIGITIASLPLFSIGLVMVLASSLARASKVGAQVLAGVFSLLAVLLLAILMIFLLDVPLALKAPDPRVLLEIKKTVLRTLIMGLAFEILFVSSAVLSFRYIFRRVKDA